MNIEYYVKKQDYFTFEFSCDTLISLYTYVYIIILTFAEPLEL